MKQCRCRVVAASLILLIGCNSQPKDIFDESNYTLVGVDSSKTGIGAKFYVYNFDSARRLSYYYWNNGKLLSKGFTYQGKIDGWFTIYDSKGRLTKLDSFSKGNKILSRVESKEDTSARIFNNGKLEKFTSLDSLYAP